MNNFGRDSVPWELSMSYPDLTDPTGTRWALAMSLPMPDISGASLAPVQRPLHKPPLEYLLGSQEGKMRGKDRGWGGLSDVAQGCSSNQLQSTAVTTDCGPVLSKLSIFFKKIPEFWICEILPLKIFLEKVIHAHGKIFKRHTGAIKFHSLSYCTATKLSIPKSAAIKGSDI